MSVAENIKRKLEEKFEPLVLELIDESQMHKGHAGYNELGESHFRVVIASRCFEGRSRLERQRMVYEVLAEEIKDRVHALSLKCLSPLEI